MATHLEYGSPMKWGKLIIAGCAVLSSLFFSDGLQANPPQQALFRASVNLVRVGVVVRDKKGRFIRNLKAQDFDVFDDGEAVKFSSFQSDVSDVSVALLIDVSGSMQDRLGLAQTAATHVVAGLDRANDEAGVFTFDSRLDEVHPFTAGLRELPNRLSSITPFGATSLYDAIAQTAERLTMRGRLRRAVIVFTDGIDTSSTMTPAEVSGLASSIDVPVYIVCIVPLIDNPSADISTVNPTKASPLGSLSDLAGWTGGHTFITSTAEERSLVAGQILGELRQQYLISFESSGRPGWHPLVVRTRDKDHFVRARSGYNAGRSRPIS
jgi:VWFA-related protein